MGSALKVSAIGTDDDGVLCVWRTLYKLAPLLLPVAWSPTRGRNSSNWVLNKNEQTMRQQQWQLLLHFHPATCSMSVAAAAAATSAATAATSEAFSSHKRRKEAATGPTSTRTITMKTATAKNRNGSRKNCYGMLYSFRHYFPFCSCSF